MANGKKVRWGILSTANIGLKKVTPAIMKSPLSEVVAVASRDLGRAEAYIAELGLTGKATAQEEPTQAQELAAGLMLKVMIQAVKCDGELDEAEKKKLMASLADASQAEMKFVNAELSAPLDIEGLAKQIPRGMEAQAYMMSLMAINLDNKNEAQYLHGFAQALDLEKEQVNAIHDHVKAPRLYS